MRLALPPGSGASVADAGPAGRVCLVASPRARGTVARASRGTRPAGHGI